MKTIEARNIMFIYGYLARNASTLGFVIRNQINRKSKTEKAVDRVTRYIKLKDFAKSHRLRAAELEIQAEKIRLELRNEQKISQRAQEDEFFRNLSMERRR